MLIRLVVAEMCMGDFVRLLFCKEKEGERVEGEDEEGEDGEEEGRERRGEGRFMI